MTFEQVRFAHPRFTYKSFSHSFLPETSELLCSFEFFLEPDIVFTPTIRIPAPSAVAKAEISQFVFHLGLIEAISYWKAACPKEVVIEAATLSPTQIRWWYDLWIHGLGEFYYTNNIDWTMPDFLSIKSTEGKQLPPLSIPFQDTKDDLVLVGGGKDSALVLSLLSQSGRKVGSLLVNPTPAAKEIASRFAIPSYTVVRIMDPKLIELNTKGYLNGHTPFSAFLAFTGSFVGVLHGYKNVIVGNEASANVGNIMLRGVEINHQYSKSLRFEERFSTYLSQYLTADVSYMSMLRPLNDVQIAALFSKENSLLPLFRSCNVGGKKGIWCGECSKCAFTYAALFPFVPLSQMKTIFGDDFYTHPKIVSYMRDLVGLGAMKPFDCVGTEEEARLLLVLAVKAYKMQQTEIPEGVLRIYADLALSDAQIASLTRDVYDQWSSIDYMTDEIRSIIRMAWETKTPKIEVI